MYRDGWTSGGRRTPNGSDGKSRTNAKQGVATNGARRSDEPGGSPTWRANPRGTTGGDAVGALGQREADPKQEEGVPMGGECHLKRGRDPETRRTRNPGLVHGNCSEGEGMTVTKKAGKPDRESPWEQGDRPSKRRRK
jgi:hypothetical protein